MSEKLFVSGDEAVALAVRQAKPHVIAAYPITPQTIVVERLSDFVEDGSLNSQYMYVESEHSAMCACLGASSIGARTFTATSSQGLLYMVEGLHYASGSRFPIVMMNANRSIAAPWNITATSVTPWLSWRAAGSSCTPKTRRRRMTRFSRPTRSLRIPM